MLHKNVIRDTNRQRLPIQWCVEHNAPLRPEWRDKCWEMASWIQTNDCQFIEAEVLLYLEQPPA